MDNLNAFNNLSNPLDKVKLIVKEVESEKKLNDSFKFKKSEITNVLKSSLKLIEENPKEKLNEISLSINEWIDNTMMQMDMTKTAIDELCQSVDKEVIKKQNFSEKVHIFRESLLSIMFVSESSFKSLYYLFLTLFIWLLLGVLASDYKSSGQIIDFSFWTSSFKYFDLILLFDGFIFLYSNLIVLFVQIINRQAKLNKRINYFIWFSIYIVYQLILFALAFAFMNRLSLSIACGLILGCETARLSMKIHSYFREKLLYGLKEYHMEYATFVYTTSKNKIIGETLDLRICDLYSELKRFWYFSFCPSLIYRDNYPMIPKRRYNLILAHFFNFVYSILFFYILTRYTLIPYTINSRFRDFYSFSNFIYDMVRFAIPGSCFLISGFFMFLHSWLNLWSEILKFGDRRFYEDWWTSTNFEEFYRKWNMVVHEWLYYYVYNDTLRFSLGKLNRIQAKFMVFFISIIVHEIIIWLGLGYFYPLLAFFFGGPGLIFTFIRTKSKKFNMIFWLEMMVGPGMIFVFYCRELLLRTEFPNLSDGIFIQYIPNIVLAYFSPFKESIQLSPLY